MANFSVLRCLLFMSCKIMFRKLRQADTDSWVRMSDSVAATSPSPGADILEYFVGYPISSDMFFSQPQTYSFMSYQDRNKLSFTIFYSFKIYIFLVVYQKLTKQPNIFRR